VDRAGVVGSVRGIRKPAHGGGREPRGAAPGWLGSTNVIILLQLEWYLFLAAI
jgi:hypothetical protein